MPQPNTELYDNSPAFLFSFSQDNLLINAINPAFLQKLNYTFAEVAGIKKLTDLLTVGSKIFYQTHFSPLLILHGKFNEIFLSFITKSGEELPVLLNVRLDEATSLFHCGGIQIEQRNRFEKELIEAKKIAENALHENELLNQFKNELELNQSLLEKQLQELEQRNNEHQQIHTIISHDLQEPLRKICMFSDELLNESRSLTIEQSDSYLKKINDSSVKMRALIMHLQQFFSLNERQVLSSSVNLNDALNDAKFKNLKDSFIQSTTYFEVDQLPTLRSNAALMVNVFDELISNSIKFKDQQKRNLQIQIRCDRIMQNIFRKLEDKYQYEAYIRIQYSDNGLGFEQQFADEIFSVFRKAHIKEGMGIGLSYCKKIMELHEGSITAEGRKGEGAKFTLLFPSSLQV
ncbi:MAG TPA: ATP-binding protein [Bacteroidia bacterium]|nr:ATP-binding protein [Bacteroidia bacterium]